MITKPLAPSNDDQARWEHSKKRKQLMDGTWKELLEAELKRHFPNVRYDVLGPSDMSVNPFEQVNRELSVLYHQAPEVTHTEGDISVLVGTDGLVTKSGLWEMSTTNQKNVLSMREAIIRVDVHVGAETRAFGESGLGYRLVTSDNVILKASPNNPDRPIYYLEYRLRGGKWYADEFDIRDPNNPSFAIKPIEDDGTLGLDVAPGLLKTGNIYSGENYPYRDAEDRPFVPAVLYHAEKTNKLWDPYHNIQMIYGSLTASCLFSMWLHLVRDACWAQKFILGALPAGVELDGVGGENKRASIPADPSSILVFVKDPMFEGQPIIGNFEIPVDPQTLLDAIQAYTMNVAIMAGLASSDISRKSGDPRSGYALSVSRYGQRLAKRKFGSIFRYSDSELMAKSAMMANRFLGTNLPESGYRISYPALPMSPDEMDALRRDVKEKVEMGAMSPVQMMMKFYPDMKEDEARIQLAIIAEEKRKYSIT